LTIIISKKTLAMGKISFEVGSFLLKNIPLKDHSLQKIVAFVLGIGSN
jgi:hypothetical protein